MTLYILVSLESRAGIAVAPAAAPRLFTKIKRQRRRAAGVVVARPPPAVSPDLHGTGGSRTRLTQPDREYTTRRLDSRRVGPKRHGAHTTLHPVPVPRLRGPAQGHARAPSHRSRARMRFAIACVRLARSGHLHGFGCTQRKTRRHARFCPADLTDSRPTSDTVTLRSPRHTSLSPGDAEISHRVSIASTGGCEGEVPAGVT